MSLVIEEDLRDGAGKIILLNLIGYLNWSTSGMLQVLAENLASWQQSRGEKMQPLAARMVKEVRVSSMGRRAREMEDSDPGVPDQGDEGECGVKVWA